MALPNFPVEGGCLCGAVRYQLTAGPLAVYNCHCKDCQRLSGAASSMSMPVRRDDFRHLSGATAGYDKPADSGRVVRMHACPLCGTRCWHEPLASPEMIVVRPGTLDRMDWAVPIGNIWVASRAAFAEIDPKLVNFDGQPSTREPLFAAWTHYVETGERFAHR